MYPTEATSVHNHLNEMVCQGCHDVMPFNLPDGSRYFKACESLEALAAEHAENHIALCPTCAAKWRYTNPVTDANFRAPLALAALPEVSVELAGKAVRIRFTQVRLDDLRVVAGLYGSRSLTRNMAASRSFR